jgi:Protein of unknown function (DUF4199)
MLRTSLVYGSVSGLVVILGIMAGLAIGTEHASSLWFGYAVMILALSAIFLGVKRHRDQELGGVIKFLPALLLGLGIAVVAGVIYVAVWEIYLAVTHYTFAEKFAAAQIAASKAHGVSGPALAKVIAEMDDFKKDYANPFFRLPMTFVEIFPVGVIIALISAAVLRNPRVLPAKA